MSRIERQKAIIDIISKKDIDTQQELTEELKNNGLVVTQATISRDIRELNLIKVLSEERHKSCYSLPNDAKYNKLKNLFHQSVVSIQSAENLVVVRTISGGANTAGAFIDKLCITEILGSVAGDDTIIIVIDSKANVTKVVARLHEMLD